MADFDLSYVLSKVYVSETSLRHSMNRGFRAIPVDGKIRPVTLECNKFTGEYSIIDADAHDLWDGGLVGIVEAVQKRTMAKISDFGRGEIVQYTGFPVYKN